MIKTNYNKIAGTYDKRYAVNGLKQIETEIKNLISLNNPQTILEAGCGTGRWIRSIPYNNKQVFGLDYSLQMLRIANQNLVDMNFVNADAVVLPFTNNLFDLVFCVNAIHHFSDKELFISECKRTLSKNGMLAIIGVDPHIDKDWYVYDYFDSVYENDLKRFPSKKSLVELIIKAGFNITENKLIEEVYSQKTGEEVLADPFLQKNLTSQLANITDKDYEKGILKIKNRIKKNPETIFTTSIKFYLLSFIKPEN